MSMISQVLLINLAIKTFYGKLRLNAVTYCDFCLNGVFLVVPQVFAIHFAAATTKKSRKFGRLIEKFAISCRENFQWQRVSFTLKLKQIDFQLNVS